jgi:hypothetical protein
MFSINMVIVSVRVFFLAGYENVRTFSQLLDRHESRHRKFFCSLPRP